VDLVTDSALVINKVNFPSHVNKIDRDWLRLLDVPRLIGVVVSQ